MRKDGIDEVPIQFEFIDKVKNLMLDWAKLNKIELYTIECIVPFILTDKSLNVWLFYSTNKMQNLYLNNGINELVKRQYVLFLKELGYPLDYLEKVLFFIDSDENVRINYQGNYFYRLR